MSVNKKKPNVVFHTEHKGAWVHQALKEGLSFIPWLEKTLNASCNDDDMPEWLGIFTQSTARQIMASGITSFDALENRLGSLHKLGFQPHQIEEINDKL
jgi:hypothetical protein